MRNGFRQPERVRANTPPELNARIDRQTEDSIHFYALQDAREISRRIDELDHEWSVDRALESEAAATGLLGLTLGVTTHSKFLLLPAMVAGMVPSMAHKAGTRSFQFFGALGSALARR